TSARRSTPGRPDGRPRPWRPSLRRCPASSTARRHRAREPDSRESAPSARVLGRCIVQVSFCLIFVCNKIPGFSLYPDKIIASLSNFLHYCMQFFWIQEILHTVSPDSTVFWEVGMAAQTDRVI